MPHRGTKRNGLKERQVCCLIVRLFPQQQQQLPLEVYPAFAYQVTCNTTLQDNRRSALLKYTLPLIVLENPISPPALILSLHSSSVQVFFFGREQGLQQQPQTLLLSGFKKKSWLVDSSVPCAISVPILLILCIHLSSLPGPFYLNAPGVHIINLVAIAENIFRTSKPHLFQLGFDISPSFPLSYCIKARFANHLYTFSPLLTPPLTFTSTVLCLPCPTTDHTASDHQST